MVDMVDNGGELNAVDETQALAGPWGAATQPDRTVD
jgi:hypothetical protein